MSDWAPLDAELDRWAESHRPATFWWRDDDAESATPALSRLLELSRTHAVPLGLAVIAARADPALLTGAGPVAGTVVLQHGFAHANHAPAGEKKAEFGPHRPLEVMKNEIANGAVRLSEAFGQRYLPLFVPPWNRITPDLLPLLPTLGMAGLSTFAPRPARSPAPGLKQLNTHIDLIDWRGTRAFKGTARLAEEIAAHLLARRHSRCDPDEPSGILSHHAVHDEGCWNFLQRLFARTVGRNNVRWLTPAQALES